MSSPASVPRSFPSSPSSSNSRTPMTEFTINPLLGYSQHDLAPQTLGGPFPCPIAWDMRRPTEYAHYIGSDQPLTFADLAQFATQPLRESLEITCGFFPGDWPIKITRPAGITVTDVLEAICASMRRRISHAEWNALSEREQGRIKKEFDTRWQAADDSGECRQNGVLRKDCLLQHTLFGGLSVHPGMQDRCILSLRRAR